MSNVKILYWLSACHQVRSLKIEQHNPFSFGARAVGLDPDAAGGTYVIYCPVVLAVYEINSFGQQHENRLCQTQVSSVHCSGHLMLLLVVLHNLCINRAPISSYSLIHSA